MDVANLKLLNYCIGPSGIQLLKFTNNALKDEEYMVIGKLVYNFISRIAEIASNPESKLVKLFIDWNPMSELLMKDQILTKISTSITIEFLTLRSNQLGN